MRLPTYVLVLALAVTGLAEMTFVAPSVAQDVDLNQVFRCAATDPSGTAACDEARGLIVNNCTVCHTFVPIVMQQFDSNGWTGLLDRHVGAARIKQLSSEQVAVIHDYLTANFNGSLPPPDLPPALLSTWTSY